MVLDDCAVPEGPSALVQYMAVLVALYLIEGVAAASQLILTSIVSERLGLRLRRAAFHSALNQEVRMPKEPCTSAVKHLEEPC